MFFSTMNLKTPSSQANANENRDYKYRFFNFVTNPSPIEINFWFENTIDLQANTSQNRIWNHFRMVNSILTTSKLKLWFQTLFLNRNYRIDTKIHLTFNYQSQNTFDSITDCQTFDSLTSNHFLHFRWTNIFDTQI